MESELGEGEIKSIVKAYILEQFLPGEEASSLGDDTKLVTDGILDSLGTLKLVSFLEEKFGVTFGAHEVDADHLDSLARIAEVIISKRR